MTAENCKHDWRIENISTHLPEGVLLHAIVRCGYCKVVKKPVKVDEFAIQGRPEPHRCTEAGGAIEEG